MDQTAALSKMIAGLMKVASAYKARAEKAEAKLATADPALVEKAANALVSGGWVESALLDQARTVLANPNEALKTLAEMSVKSAEAIDAARSKAGLDPRISAGTAVGRDGTVKAAGERVEPNYVGSRVENEHDREFNERVLSYRTQMDPLAG